MGAPDDAGFERIEQWATEIVQSVIQSPDEQRAVLQVMRLLTEMQARIQRDAIDEIGRRLHAVPTTSRPSRGEREP